MEYCELGFLGSTWSYIDQDPHSHRGHGADLGLSGEPSMKMHELG